MLRNAYKFAFSFISRGPGIRCKPKFIFQGGALISTALAIRHFTMTKDSVTVYAKKSARDKDHSAGTIVMDEASLQQLTLREQRFVRFASCEYDGQLYMTPGDFLDSLTEANPKPRLSRRKLESVDLEKMAEATPPKKNGSTKLFRALENSGIISYTEYLFLLSVLTTGEDFDQPHSGFRIAFNMFDTDGNQRVDKQEFLVLERIFSSVSRKGNGDALTLDNCSASSEQKEHVNTTLLIHLFGKNGKDSLSFTDFCRFMVNLQTEVLELEFAEYAKAKPVISETDFAKILLRYTYIRGDDYQAVLDRMKRRIPTSRGITFEQFKAFCQFLNNLDDFSIAMRMFTLANQPISQEEFHRAVLICTDQYLDNHVVNTVFQIFDADGDGFLSHKEFIAIMRDRIHRGLRSHLVSQEGWAAFKSCVKEELRAA